VEPGEPEVAPAKKGDEPQQSIEEKEVSEARGKIPGMQDEEDGVISMLNGIASALQRLMLTNGTPLITVVVTGRHEENSGVYEIECPGIGSNERLAAKLSASMAISAHLGHVRGEIQRAIKS